MTPYYEDDYVTIYNADCREILPGVDGIDCILTDPIWPNALPQWEALKPWELFAQMCQQIEGRCNRLVVQLGCDSDPRFLGGVPAAMPFLRVCWLDYARPSYKGRLLYTGDVAYAFGSAPEFIKGRQVMSGMCRSSKTDKLFHRGTKHKRHVKDFDRREYHELPHPSPRRLQHVLWLVHQFGDNLIVDPFGGSCTTAVAAKSHGKKCVCIEIEERFCELGAKRLQQEMLPLA